MNFYKKILDKHKKYVIIVQMNISKKFKRCQCACDWDLILELEKKITGANNHRIRGKLQEYMNIIAKFERKKLNKKKYMSEKKKCEDELRGMIV